jgi:predicted HD superfamily hydrolase involved in NAD metabolism
MDYTKNNQKEILNWLQSNLDNERLSHSIGCAQTAVELAKKFGQDEEKAYLAGLLHDCAKGFKTEKLLEMIKQHLPEVDECEISNPKTLHAPVSAYIARNEFGVEDEEILSAIRWHTLGKVDMTKFEKIIFLADKIEPNTRDLEYRENMLKVLENDDDLNKALLICYKETIKSLVKRNLKICQPTIDIYNSLQKG